MTRISGLHKQKWRHVGWVWSHIKTVSVLKACKADMPYVCWGEHRMVIDMLLVTFPFPRTETGTVSPEMVQTHVIPHKLHNRSAWWGGAFWPHQSLLLEPPCFNYLNTFTLYSGCDVSKTDSSDLLLKIFKHFWGSYLVVLVKWVLHSLAKKKYSCLLLLHLH